MREWAVVLILPLAGCGLCANEVISETPRPDGELKAVLFQRDCGATTGFSSQISILGSHMRTPLGSGTLFRADTDHGHAAAGPWGGPMVRMEWLSNKTLRISYAAGTRVFHQDYESHGVKVEYVAMADIR